MPIDPKKHYPIAALLASWSHPGNLLPNDASGERVAKTCINDLRDAIEAEVGILNKDIESLMSLEELSDWERGYIDGVRKAVSLLRMVERSSVWGASHRRGSVRDQVAPHSRMPDLRNGVETGDCADGGCPVSTWVQQREERPMKLKKFWVGWSEPRAWVGQFGWEGPWWRTRNLDADQNVSAAVVARSRDEAMEIIENAYSPPRKLNWNYTVKHHDDWSPFSGRHPQEGWMKWPWPMHVDEGNEIDRLRAENAELKRELHRWQTGTQIEGDYVGHWVSRSDFEELERRCDALEMENVRLKSVEERCDALESIQPASLAYYTDAHDGPGWYWYAKEYPSEGSTGPFLSCSEAVANLNYAGQSTLCAEEQVRLASRLDDALLGLLTGEASTVEPPKEKAVLHSTREASECPMSKAISELEVPITDKATGSNLKVYCACERCRGLLDAAVLGSLLESLSPTDSRPAHMVLTEAINQALGRGAPSDADQ